MAGHNFYILSSLPPAGEPGSVPPISPAEFLQRVSYVRGLRDILEALFLGHDLLLREALRAEELDELEDLVVLSPAQARDESPLPSFLVPSHDPVTRRIPADDMWEAYFSYAAAVARRRHCAFLAAWVGFEVALRNALCVERAKALNLDAHDYVVAPHLAGEEDLSGALNEWAAATTPLGGLRVLDTVRWAWLRDHDGWFTFRDDEVASYGAKLILLNRWQRLAKAEAAGASAPSGAQTSEAVASGEGAYGHSDAGPFKQGGG